MYVDNIVHIHDCGFGRLILSFCVVSPELNYNCIILRQPMNDNSVENEYSTFYSTYSITLTHLCK